jgi:putative DNA primase/helicase
MSNPAFQGPSPLDAERFKKFSDNAETDPFAKDGPGEEGAEEQMPWDEAVEKGACTSTELSTLQIVPRQKVIDDWCCKGDLGFIFAMRGLGKTWKAMNLAHGIAEGRDVGPWKIHLSEKVLYLDGEMPPSDTKARDKALGSPTDNLIYVNHEILFERTGRVMNLADRKFQIAVLERCVTAGFGVLFLDNLSTLASGVDENKAIDWELLLPWLMQLRRAHVTVIFVHHAGRNNEMRGHSKREDPCAWIMRLDAPNNADDQPGAHFITRFTKWRSAQKQPKTYEWIYSPQASAEVLVEVKEASPLDVLRHLIEIGLDTCSQLAEEMDVTLGYVSQLATIAIKQGWLEKKNRKYVLTDPR